MGARLTTGNVIEQITLQGLSVSKELKLLMPLYQKYFALYQQLQPKITDGQKLFLEVRLPRSLVVRDPILAVVNEGHGVGSD